MNRATKGTIEADIANALTRFHREQQGRGPSDVRAHLLSDMVVVRSSGIFTATEARLATSDDGRKIIKSARQELRSINYREAEALVEEIVGCGVLRSYCDVNVDVAEQMEVYMLEADVEKRLLRQDLDRLNGPPIKRAA